MLKQILTSGLCVGVLAMTGCSELPGTDEQQGAVIGGASGAIAGAAIGGSEHRLLGALIGGALGAGGGYLIGANKDKITGKDKDSAEEAVRKAQTNPATAQSALNATTADLNSDGFVTLDEVTAMKTAGLTDEQMIARLRATDQVFELTSAQEQQLRSQGVSQAVITEMEQINREERDRLLSNQPSSVISQPPP